MGNQIFPEITKVTYVWKTTDPSSSDSSYPVPCIWVNTSSDTAFMLTDNTPAAAVWLTLGGSFEFLEWQNSVKDKDLSAPPGAPSTGDRYIVASGGSGAWSGEDDNIAEWSGSAWGFVASTEGFACWVDDEDVVYIFNGSAWVKFGTIVDHGNLLGLGDDDHSGHPWGIGRSGGQTLIGGIGSGDDLTLKSTSHGTRGIIHFGADDLGENLEIHDAGTLKFWDDSDDTSVTFGPVTDGTTILEITGSLSLSGEIDMGSQRITSLGNPTASTDAVNLHTLLENVDLNLHYWFGSGTLDLLLTDSEDALLETPDSDPKTLTTITFKSSVADTATPFLIKAGAIISIHYAADVTSVSGKHDEQLKFQLGYVDADGTTGFSQIGSDTDLSAVLTATKTFYASHVHVSTDTTVPSGKRLWLKVIADATLGGSSYPEINFYFDAVEHHFSFGIGGEVLDNFVLKVGDTMTGALILPSLSVTASTGNAATLNLIADAGEDNSDKWKLEATDGDEFNIYSYASGAFVSKLALDSNSFFSMSNNDLGTSNTIFGKDAGLSLDAGSNYNVFIGEGVSDAAMDNASGNVGVGHTALSALTEGDYNTAIGKDALQAITTASYNTAVGRRSLLNSNAASNTAIGHNSMTANTSGANNVAVGDAALDTNTTGFQNVAIGSGAMGGVTSANAIQDNIAIGYQAMDDSMTSAAIQNIAIGTDALGALTSGPTNIGIGDNTGITITTGSDNILIGDQANVSASGAVNQIVIGADLTGIADNTVHIGNSSIITTYLAGAVVGKLQEIVQPSTDTLTALEVSGTLVNNLGQSSENTQTLPPAAKGLNFIVNIATTGQGAFHVKAGGSDKIYLDGTALNDADKVSLATPALADFATFWCFETSSSVYDWQCKTGNGTWTDGGV